MVITQSTADILKVSAEEFFDHVEVTDSSIYIHIPDLTVTNELGLSIDIKGLLLKLTYSFVQDRIVFYSMEGTRTHLNLSQYIRGYFHSHLPRCNMSRGNLFQRFCLGSTSLREIIVGGEEHNLESLDYLFGLIHSFIRTESLEGVPHIKMEVALDVGKSIADLVKPPAVNMRALFDIGKHMLDNNALEYNYIKSGIIPRISIKGGDNELLDKCLIDHRLAIDTTDMNVLSILRLKNDSICEDTEGVYFIDLDDPIGEGDLCFNEVKIIPTEEEINFLQENVVTGDLQRNIVYNYLEILFNKYLNA